MRDRCSCVVYFLKTKSAQVLWTEIALLMDRWDQVQVLDIEVEGGGIARRVNIDLYLIIQPAAYELNSVIL